MNDLIIPKQRRGSEPQHRGSQWDVLQPPTVASVRKHSGATGDLSTWGTLAFSELTGQISLAQLPNLTWTAVAFDAANFTASSGNWTVDAGDQSSFSYLLMNKTMGVTFAITPTTVSATPSNLRITLPASKTVAKRADAAIVISDNGTVGIGLAVALVSTTYISLFVGIGASNWATSTNATTVAGTIWLEVA